MTEEKSLFQIQRSLVLSILGSGLILTLSFFVALWRIDSAVFRYVWCLHLLVHAISLAGSAYFLAKLIGRLQRGMAIAYMLFFFFFIAIILFQGSAPIISRDALIYHLATPKFWIESTRITEIDWHEWSHFPLLLSVSYAGFIQTGLERLTPAYHFSYLLLSSGVLASFVYYKTKARELSVFAAFFLLTIPLCIKLASEPMADLGCALFAGLGFCLLVVAAEQRWSHRAYVFSGLAWGLALSSKYNSFLAFACCLLAVILLFVKLDYQFKLFRKNLLVLSCGAVFLVSPWLIKNFYFTGNPFYPFLGSFFSSSTAVPFMGSTKAIEYRLHGYGESWLQVLLLPFRVMFEGEDNNPRLFDGVLSPLLLLLFVPVIFRANSERRAPWIVASLVYIAIFFLTSISLFYLLIRYQAPLLIPATALVAIGCGQIQSYMSEKKGILFLRFLLLVQLLIATGYSWKLLHQSGTWKYYSEQQTVSQFLNERLGEYPLIEYVNRKLPKTARIYLLFTGNRYYYYQREVRGNYFSAAPLLDWLGSEKTASDLALKFSNRGITHLGIHNRRLAETLDRSLNEVQKQLWNAFIRDELELIENAQGFSLWKIKRLS